LRPAGGAAAALAASAVLSEQGVAGGALLRWWWWETDEAGKRLRKGEKFQSHPDRNDVDDKVSSDCALWRGWAW